MRQLGSDARVLFACAVQLGKDTHVARCFSQGRARDRKLTHGPFDLVNTGVTTDKNTPLNAAIMSATVLLYLIIQVLRGRTTKAFETAKHATGCRQSNPA